MDISKKILLIANGKFPTINLVKDILLSNPSIICCDGAAEKALNNNLNPDIVIGDMDSMNPYFNSKLSDKIIRIEEQNTNDLSKALNWINQKDVDSVTIIGADGYREDHSLGNILLLLENKYKYKISMISEFGRFDLINNEVIDSNNSNRHLFKSFKGQGVSIFCLDKKVILNSKGLKYPLKNFSFSRLYDASLNIATKSNFSIICNKKDINVLVYRANEKT